MGIPVPVFLSLCESEFLGVSVTPWGLRYINHRPPDSASGLFLKQNPSQEVQEALLLWQLFA